MYELISPHIWPSKIYAKYVLVLIFFVCVRRYPGFNDGNAFVYKTDLMNMTSLLRDQWPKSVDVNKLVQWNLI